MLLKSLFFFFFFFFNHSFLAFDIIVTKNFEVTREGEGTIYSFDRGIRLDYTSNPFTRYSIISSEATPEKLKIHKETHLEMFALTPPKGFKVIPNLNFKEEVLPVGLRISPIGESKDGYINIALLDENGTRVNIDGSRKWYKRTYQITKSQYEKLSSQFYVTHIEELASPPLIRPCPSR